VSTRGPSLVEVEFLRAVGKRIRLLRLAHELTQDELAEASGISRAFINLLEHGGHGVDVVRLLRLATALHVSLTELLDVESPLAGHLPAAVDRPFVADRVEGLPS
jgi:transcriptional regulator with XRE-family HTH domain